MLVIVYVVSKRNRFVKIRFEKLTLESSLAGNIGYRKGCTPIEISFCLVKLKPKGMNGSLRKYFLKRIFRATNFISF